MLEDLTNIVQTCNRKEITNLQTRCMLASLAQALISLMSTNLPQIKKTEFETEMKTEDDTPKGQNYIQEQIQIVKQFVVKKLAAVEALDVKVQKLNDITQEYIDERINRVTENQVKMETKFSTELNRKANTLTVENQLKEIYLFLGENEKKLQKDVCKKLREEIKSTADLMEKKLKDQSERIKQNQDNWKKLFTIISENKIKVVEEDKLNLEEKVFNIMNLKQLEKVEDWIDPQCFWFKRLKFQGSVIRAFEQAAVFGKKVIGRYFVFSIQIKMMKSWIGVGVIDSSYKGKDVLVNQERWISYGSSGRLYNGKQRKYQGSGFKANEIVTVIVDRGQGIIEWNVAGETRHKLFSLELRNLQVEWVPYIYMNSRNDCISISE